MSAYIFVDNSDFFDNISVIRNNVGDFLVLGCNSEQAFRTPISMSELAKFGKALMSVASGKKKKAKLKIASFPVKVYFDGRTVIAFSFTFTHPAFSKEADVDLEYTGFGKDELLEFAEKTEKYNGEKISVRKCVDR